MDISPGNPLGPTVEGSELNIPSAAQGDVLYYNGTTWTRLAAGTSGYYLKTQGAAANPVWAASPANVAVGSYTGDGAADQGITGLGFTPKGVWVFGEADLDAIWWKSTNATSDWDFRHLGATTTQQQAGAAFEGILTLDADGFSVSDGSADADPNKNGSTYWYLAVG